MKLCVKRALRGIAAVAAVSAAIAASGCADRSPGDALSYQRSDFRGDFVLTFDGDDDSRSAVLTVEKPADANVCRLIFTAGELAGATVEISDSGITLSDGSGFNLPLSCTPGSPVRAVASGFAVSENDVTSVAYDNDSGSVTAICDGGTVGITVSDGVPVKLDFDTLFGEFSLSQYRGDF